MNGKAIVYRDFNVYLPTYKDGVTHVVLPKYKVIAYSCNSPELAKSWIDGYINGEKWATDAYIAPPEDALKLMHHVAGGHIATEIAEVLEQHLQTKALSSPGVISVFEGT